MGSKNGKAGNLLQQEPGPENRLRKPANSPKVAHTERLIHSPISGLGEDAEPGRAQMFRGQNTSNRHDTPWWVTPSVGGPFVIRVKGRVGWALDRLWMADAKGCTPITEPAPRWSAYVHDLRRLGVEIETVREPHGEPFPGLHGRYVLRSTVRRAAQ